MKSILKLVFLGVVIAIVVNVLDKRNIDALGVAKTFLKSITSEIEKLSEVQESQNEPNAAEIFSDEAEIAYETYSEVQEMQTDDYSATIQGIELTDETTDFKEFDIPQRQNRLSERFSEQD